MDGWGGVSYVLVRCVYGLGGWIDGCENDRGRIHPDLYLSSHSCLARHKRQERRLLADVAEIQPWWARGNYSLFMCVCMHVYISTFVERVYMPTNDQTLLLRSFHH
jgi:hypothetical protein